MTRTLVACLVLTGLGCTNQAWTVPQPNFRTTQPAGAFERARAAVEKHCGGLQSADANAEVMAGAWLVWPQSDELVLTQCLVSLQRGDEHVVDVRVTFATRRCPPSDSRDPGVLLPTCEPTETVPEAVKNRLEQLGEALEADIRLR